MSIYRGMDKAALDAAYNNTVAVPESPRWIADWERRSNELAAQHPQHLDLRYGPRDRNRIDYFKAKRSNAPVLVFIHGGYWQMRAKENFRCFASGLLAHDISVALIGYTLAPEATLTEIVGEIDTGLTWFAQHLERNGGACPTYLSGWSAGGHLTAMSLGHPSVRGGLAISGIFDLEPMQLSYLNERLKLSDDEVAKLSPLRNIPATSVPLIITYGKGELPELQRQSEEYAAARARAGLKDTLAPLPDHNHFTIVAELASPDGALTTLVRDLMRS